MLVMQLHQKSPKSEREEVGTDVPFCTLTQKGTSIKLITHHHTGQGLEA